MSKETPGLVFPLEITADNAGYKLAELKETVKFNLKNIILTSPGERIMIPDFGVGIRRVLFETPTPDITEAIFERIGSQISLYAPYVSILELSVTQPTVLSLNIRLKYEIDFAEIVDFIEIEISNI